MTALHLHELAGCTPTPLAHYLKALAVLRLVAEQADPAARGLWRGERFLLLTHLDRSALHDFFLRRYAPTPLIAPWNGGSGFYPKDNTEGPDALARATAPRFAAYQAALAAGKALTQGLADAPKKEEKAALIRRCQDTWRGPLADWLGAVLVLDADGDPTYPALLGTGGNDGRLDFTNNFMRRLVGLFDLARPDAPPTPAAALHLEAALWGSPTSGLESAAIGQFHPGAAGGANQGAGFSAESLVNPWDFVLMLEGALVFRAALSRRADTSALPQAAAPFALRPSAVGYGSAAEADESARGEQWMPLWSAPATYTEVAHLFAEGRAQLHGRPATRPLDFARALARLGVARGIDAFERYGYIERNGQSNLAVPLGRWRVHPRPHQDLLDVLAPWVDDLRRAARDKHAPRSALTAARACEEAMLACCRGAPSPASTRPGSPARSSTTTADVWQALLLHFADAEAQLLHSPRFTAGASLTPLPRLPFTIVDAADLQGFAEGRLALALAGLHGTLGGAPDLRDPLRRHWLPLDLAARPGRPTFRTDAGGLARPADLVAAGRDLLRDLPLVLRRRAVERRTRPHPHTLGLTPAVDAPWAYARPADLVAFLRGDLDDRRLLTLARALMALDWPTAPRSPSPAPVPEDNLLSPLFGLLRLALPHADLPTLNLRHYDPLARTTIERSAPALAVALDPAVLERLLAGDLSGAFRAAHDRLRIAGLRPHLHHAAARGGPFPRRLAAALLFPLADLDLHRLVLRLTKPDAAEPPPADPDLDLDLDADDPLTPPA